MWGMILGTLIGLWLMAAPAVLGYTDGTAALSDRVVGPLAVTFSFVAIWEVLRPLRLVNRAAALWLVAAPWFLGFPVAAQWNSVAAGILLFVSSFPRGSVNTRFGGGWSTLWPPCRVGRGQERLYGAPADHGRDDSR